jgi:hypothetical protein
MEDSFLSSASFKHLVINVFKICNYTNHTYHTILSSCHLYYTVTCTCIQKVNWGRLDHTQIFENRPFCAV